MRSLFVHKAEHETDGTAQEELRRCRAWMAIGSNRESCVFGFHWVNNSLEHVVILFLRTTASPRFSPHLSLLPYVHCESWARTNTNNVYSARKHEKNTQCASTTHQLMMLHFASSFGRKQAYGTQGYARVHSSDLTQNESTRLRPNSKRGRNIISFSRVHFYVRTILWITDKKMYIALVLCSWTWRASRIVQSFVVGPPLYSWTSQKVAAKCKVHCLIQLYTLQLFLFYFHRTENFLDVLRQFWAFPNQKCFELSPDFRLCEVSCSCKVQCVELRC